MSNYLCWRLIIIQFTQRIMQSTNYSTNHPQHKWHTCAKAKKHTWHQTMCVHTCEIKVSHTCTYPYKLSVTKDPSYHTAWYSYGLYSKAVCVSFRLLWITGSDPNG